MASLYGKNLRVSIFGQSHSKAIGVSVDGFPAGRTIDFEELTRFMEKRAPGRNNYSTARKEADRIEILSGMVDGKTCGAPFAAIIHNMDVKSEDYKEIMDVPRPSHADYTAQLKYGGAQDTSGGGHFSGRLTAPLCIAGGICKQILQQEGIEIVAHIAQIADVEDTRFNPVDISEEDLRLLAENDFPTIDPLQGNEMKQVIEAARKNEDSVGGIIECAITGLPGGIGEPIFDGVENKIAAIMFGIPAVKGIEFGNGFECASLLGSENNDSFHVENGKVKAKTNRHGGILGGITSGMPVIFRVALKPTPSIGKTQESVSLSRMENTLLAIKGRHDPCIVPRAVVCVEAAAAIAVLDLIIEEYGRRLR